MVEQELYPNHTRLEVADKSCRVIPGPPYKLLGNRIVFTNWTFVFQGSSQWQDCEGRNVTVVGDQGPDEANLVSVGFNPKGVHLALYPARSQGPILHLEKPWDKDGAVGTILQDEGVYRAWVATGWGDLHLANPHRRPSSALCYMESRDGYDWFRPDCGTVSLDGFKKHNVVLSTHCFIGGGLTVFRDPIGDPSERYKITAECNNWDDETIAQYEQRYPHDFDARAVRSDANITLGILGAVSPDGLSWKVLPEPLVVTHCDTQLVGTYNSTLEQYLIYTRDYIDLPLEGSSENYAAHRMVQYARRGIGLTRSRDFYHFPLPQVVLQADLTMKPSEVLYTNCYTTIPGAPDHHLMFPAVWDLCHHDETYIRVASSYDGLLWQYLPGPAVLSTNTFGNWDGGCVYTHPNLIELPNGDWALPYTGFNVPHKYPRVNARRNTGYALWPRGRMVSIKADEEGQFETIPVIPPGRHLYINALTRRAGSIQVEVVNKHGRVISGREFQACKPLFGDLHWVKVEWGGRDELGINSHEDVSLRFRLNQAEIFGLEFR